MSPTGNDSSTAREGSEPRLLLEYSPPCRHSESTNSLASDSAAARLLAWTNLVVKKPTALPSPTAQSMPRPEIVILKCGIEIGRASGRDRACQYVSISVAAVSLKKKETRK